MLFWSCSHVHLGHWNIGCRSIKYNDRYICWSICHGRLPKSTMEKMAKSSAHQKRGYFAHFPHGLLSRHSKLVRNERLTQLSYVSHATICFDSHHSFFIKSKNHAFI